MKRVIIFFILLFACIASADDANDFGWSIVSYVPGSGVGFYSFPQSAIGRPSIDTSFNGDLRPVLPVFPAFGLDQLVTIGTGGHIIIEFNHNVGDDENNPYGYDFIVFGNSLIVIDGASNYAYNDPCSLYITLVNVNREFGTVSVSQDGQSWYSFDNGSFADDFAPTLARVFDPNDPNDSYPDWDNQWWSELTDPTLPLDPNVEAADFVNNTLDKLCYAYGRSAGGTAFDLKDLAPEDFNSLADDPNTGQKWIRYIKVTYQQVNPQAMSPPEIDAVSDVSCCGDYKRPSPIGDITRDCSVDYDDLLVLAAYWLCEVTGDDEMSLKADLFVDTDNIINFLDIAVLAKNWMFSN